MKKVLLIALLVLVVSTMSIFAANDRLGIGAGLALRAPFGIGAVGEYDFGVARVNLTVGYLTGTFHVGIGGEYVLPGIFHNKDLNIGLQASAGGKIDLGFAKGFTNIDIGLPITLAYYFDSVPIKIYGSAIPGLAIAVSPGWTFTTFGSQLEIGAMWLF